MQKRATPTLKENRAHGDAQFPLAAYCMSAGPGKIVVNCHWHEEAEFFYVLEGQLQFQIGAAYFPVKSGEAVFVHSADIHAGYALPSSGCRFFALVFDMNLLRSGYHDRLQSEYILPLLDGRKSLPSHITKENVWGRQILQDLDGIREAMEDHKVGYELKVKSHLFMILAEIASGNHWVLRNAQNTTDSRLDRLRTVLTFIEENYQRKIQLKELAALAHMSEAHFCRFFKVFARKTPVEYVNSYRIAMAAEILATGDRKLLDIALDVGFEQPSYFIKKFRELMNCTPAEYRKRVHANSPSPSLEKG